MAIGRQTGAFFLSKLIGALVLVVVAIVLLAVAFGSSYTVDEGERGVELRYGKVVNVAEPGLHFKIPFVDTVQKVSVQNQSVVYGLSQARKSSMSYSLEHETTVDPGAPLAAYSRDQQPATLRVSVSFHVPPDQVEALYSQYGDIDTMVSRLINRKVPDEVKNVFGQYNAVTVIQERTKFGLDALAAVRKAVSGPVVIDSIQVEELAFSASYEKSIEDRMRAEVEIQTKRQNLETERINAEIAVTQAKARADSVVAEARAEAEAISIRGDAEARAIQVKGEALRQNAGLVALTQAERWDGKLPQTMIPGGGVPFLNLSEK